MNEGRWPMERHLLPEHNALIQRCLEAHPDDPNACAATRVGISEYVPFNIWTPERRTANTIALFHYVTKSRQDFQSKVDRGSAKTGSAKSIRSWDQFDFWERCAAVMCSAAITYRNTQVAPRSGGMRRHP